jgi:predicted RNase H-like nuclease
MIHSRISNLDQSLQAVVNWYRIDMTVLATTQAMPQRLQTALIQDNVSWRRFITAAGALALTRTRHDRRLIPGLDLRHLTKGTRAR